MGQRVRRYPPALQEHVLWWGFGLSALLRGAVIVSGGLFIAAQKEAILLFSAVVIYSGYRHGDGTGATRIVALIIL
jgi:predicted tellurium resistance membrane protein TerC